jgi:hypothetical protein
VDRHRGLVREHQAVERQAEEVRPVGVGCEVLIGVGLEVLHCAQTQPAAGHRLVDEDLRLGHVELAVGDKVRVRVVDAHAAVLGVLRALADGGVAGRTGHRDAAELARRGACAPQVIGLPV